VVTAPTCTEKGYTTYTCTNCQHSYTADQVAAKGHSYAEGSCQICGAVDPGFVPPYALVGDMNGWNETAHVMTGDGTVSVTVTLEQGIYKFKICQGDVCYGNDGVIINTTVTTNTAGWDMSPSANHCTLSASGGEYTFTFDPVSCKLIVVHHTNETESDPVVNGTITLNSVSLSLEAEINYNLYFQIENMTVTEANLGLLIWDDEPALPTINGGGTVIEGATYVPATGQYGISTMGIPAKDMGDLKYMVVYAKLPGGNYVYSKVLQYSARVYCMNRVEKSSNDKMRALCVALMNYGAEAQKFFASTTDYTYTQLMNEGFESYQYLVADYSDDLLQMPGGVSAEKTGVFGTTVNGFSSRSVSMSADGILALNYYFTTSRAVDKVTFYYWTAEQYNAVTELTAANASGSKEMALTATENQYWASFDGIAAKDMDRVIYACGVYEIDGQTYSTGVIAYSLAKYCANRANVAGEFQSFAAATAVYGYHAKTYFGI
jgi:hypothetical protein